MLCKELCNQGQYDMITWSIYQGNQANESIVWDGYDMINYNATWIYGEFR